MKKILLPILALTLVACDRNETPGNPPSQRTEDFDNTGINDRDRNFTTRTSGDQSENEADRAITQKIRQAIMSDNSLSTNAKNIKIITIDGVVTLRGPVLNQREKDAIAKKITDIQRNLKVDNQLEVTRDNGNNTNY